MMTQHVKSAPAILQGQARRISAADKADKAEIELNGRPALMRATVQITRAATGKVEEYEIVGTAEKGAN